jgi:hypothetical protein
MTNRNQRRLAITLLTLFILSLFLFGLMRPRYIGRTFNAKTDSAYVKDKLWSYDGGFKIGQGDFLEFRMGTTVFDLRGDTIFYKSKPRAKVTRLNRRLFQMRVESIETGEKGTYLNVDEQLQ